MTRLLACLSAAAIMAAAACSDNATAPARISEVGTYQLVRVDGVALPAPFPLSNEFANALATSGTLTVVASGQWNAEVLVLIPSGFSSSAPISQTTSGTYSRTGDTLYFREGSNGEVLTGLLAGNRITASVDGVRFEFERK